MKTGSNVAAKRHMAFSRTLWAIAIRSWKYYWVLYNFEI